MTTDLSHLDFEPVMRCESGEVRRRGWLRPVLDRCSEQATCVLTVLHVPGATAWECLTITTVVCDHHAGLLAVGSLRQRPPHTDCPGCSTHITEMTDVVRRREI